jgi:hypothetical protein
MEHLIFIIHQVEAASGTSIDFTPANQNHVGGLDAAFNCLLKPSQKPQQRFQALPDIFQTKIYKFT